MYVLGEMFALALGAALSTWLFGALKSYYEQIHADAPTGVRGALMRIWIATLGLGLVAPPLLIHSYFFRDTRTTSSYLRWLPVSVMGYMSGAFLVRPTAAAAHEWIWGGVYVASAVCAALYGCGGLVHICLSRECSGSRSVLGYALNLVAGVSYIGVVGLGYLSS